MDTVVANNTVAQLHQGTGFPPPLQLLLLQFLSSALNPVSFSKEGDKSVQEWKNSFLHVNELKDNLFRLLDMVERSFSNQDLQQNRLEGLENKMQLLESKIDNIFTTVVKDRDIKTDLLVSKLKLQNFEIMHQFQEQEKKLNTLQSKLKEDNDRILKTISHFEEELQSLKSNLQEQPNNIKSNMEEEIGNLGSKLLEKLDLMESNLQVRLESLESNLDKKLTTQNESLQVTVFRLAEELKSQEDKTQTVLKSVTNIEKIELQCQAENSQCQSLLTVRNVEISRLTEELNNVQILLNSTTDEVHSCRQRINIAQEVLKMSESQREDKLLEAAENGSKTLTETLLLLGTDASARDAKLNTPLHLAAYYGHTDVARLLIDAGTDMNAKATYDSTPLHLATNSDNAATVIRLLVAHGAPLEAVDTETRTPLLWAAGQSNSLPAVQTLLSLGANKAARDMYGRTLLGTAKIRGNNAVANWLSAH